MSRQTSNQQIPQCKTDEEYRQEGNNFFKRGELSLAMQCYLEGIKLNPGNATLHYNLAVVFGELGRYREAIEAFNQVMRLDPNYLDFTKKLEYKFSVWAKREFDNKNYVLSAWLYHQILKDNPKKEHVQSKRDALANWGGSLEERCNKERFDNNNYLTQDFDREALQLIEVLLIHDEFCSQHGLEDEKQQLRTIGNFCLTLAYLSKNFRAKYIAEKDGFEYCIWDDLIYLGLSTLGENNLLYPHRILIDSKTLLGVRHDLHQVVLPFIQKILQQKDIHRLAAIEKELDAVQEPLNLINEQLEGNDKKGVIGLNKEIFALQSSRKEAKIVIEKAKDRVAEIEKEINELEKEVKEDQGYLEENKESSQQPWYQRNQLALERNLKRLHDKKEQLAEWTLKKDRSEKTLTEATEEKISILIEKQRELTKEKEPLDQKKQLLLNEQNELKKCDIFEAKMLFAVVNQHREEKALQKIIEYCEVSSDEDYRRESVLRRLFVIGEQLNKQKLTPQTKNLLIKTAESMSIKIDWTLLNLIRNRLAHPENDIYRLTLKKYVKKNGLRRIIEEDLPNIRRVVLCLINNSQWKERSLSYYENLEGLDKQPEGIPMGSLQSLRDHLPNETMHKSESGQLFRRENQLYIIELVLSEIAEIEQLLKSLNTFDEKALLYALEEDQAELQDTEEKKSATEFMNQLRSFKPELTTALMLAQQQIIQYHRSLLIRIPRPSNVANGHMEMQHISSFLDVKNSKFYAECIINYGKLCLLYSELSKREHIQYAIEYRLSLIEEYFKLIDPQYLEAILPKMKQLEAHMHRNAMGHGETYFDLMPQLEMHIHYAVWYRQNITPAFREIEGRLLHNPQQFDNPLSYQEAKLFDEFLQVFNSKQDLQDMIGGFVCAAQQHFIYSSNGFLRSEQRQALFCFIVLFHQLNQWKEHNHQQDNPGLNALEFDNGIAILPELIITDGEAGIQTQLTDILNCYAALQKPIYLCVNQGGYHYTTLVIIPGSDGFVKYRYIDPLMDNQGEWVGLPADIQRGLASALQTLFPHGVSILNAPSYTHQQDNTGNHNNECGFHNIYYTLYMLMVGPNADLSQMRQFFAGSGHPIPGNNPAHNGGIDTEDAERFIRPWFQKLFHRMLNPSHGLVSNLAQTIHAPVQPSTPSNQPQQGAGMSL